MNQLKNMYSSIVHDSFPEKITMDFGGTNLVYKRCSWTINNEQKGLRYGENPDQPAAMYILAEGTPIVDGITYRGAGQGIVSTITEEQMLQVGKHPGKTNFTDIDSGINILQYLAQKPAAAIIKHNNPCGVAWSDISLEDSLQKAFWCDRVAAFGGAIVVNRPITKKMAEFISERYFEVIAAPDFEEESLPLLKKRKNLRIIKLPALSFLEKFVGIPFLDITSLQDGGLIFQHSFVNKLRSTEDFIPAIVETSEDMVMSRKPTQKEVDDLLFAWAVESGVTSNSVIFAKDGTTVAIGTGEQDRVGCVEVAIQKAYAKFADALAFKQTGLSLYELKEQRHYDYELNSIFKAVMEETKEEKGGLIGSVLVSDGFFPFRDGVDIAIAEGITAIAQPGGSLRDAETIAATNEASPQVAMVFTGQRSFKH